MLATSSSATISEPVAPLKQTNRRVSDVSDKIRGIGRRVRLHMTATRFRSLFSIGIRTRCTVFEVSVDAQSCLILDIVGIRVDMDVVEFRVACCAKILIRLTKHLCVFVGEEAAM
jgi:hypothetical protein